MKIGLGSYGLGDTTEDCSTNPCSWWDQVWVGDTCLAWLQQCNPTDPRVIAMKSGFVAGTVAAAAETIQAGVTPVGVAAGGIAGNTLAALFGGLFVNADGTTNWVTVGVAGVAALAAVEILTKR